MLLDISIIPQTSEELFYFVTRRIPYLCGFWRFANDYIQNMAARSRKKQRHLELLQAMGQIKILMLEKAPEYPQKPFVAYAASYIIAAINFAATVQAAISLVEYIP